MRTIIFAFALAFLSTAAFAQAPAPSMPDMKTFASSADVKALIAKAQADRKPDQEVTIEHILTLAPYGANLEYRTAPFTANVHEHQAELFYVIDGSATLVTGGKLINEKRQNAENLAGSGIEGGTSQAVAKGDFFIVPENTPHWFSAINQTLILMSLHVPGGAATH